MIEPIIRISRPGFDIDPWGDFVEVHYAERWEDGTIQIAQPGNTLLKRRGDCEPVDTQPILRIPTRDNAVLQSMMQQLWDMGVRPVGMNSVGADAAKESHLQDMRALVSSMMKVQLPGQPIK